MGTNLHSLDSGGDYLDSASTSCTERPKEDEADEVRPNIGVVYEEYWCLVRGVVVSCGRRIRDAPYR